MSMWAQRAILSSRQFPQIYIQRKWEKQAVWADDDCPLNWLRNENLTQGKLPERFFLHFLGSAAARDIWKQKKKSKNSFFVNVNVYRFHFAFRVCRFPFRAMKLATSKGCVRWHENFFDVPSSLFGPQWRRWWMNIEWNGERKENSFQNINDQRHNIRVESRHKICEKDWKCKTLWVFPQIINSPARSPSIDTQQFSRLRLTFPSGQNERAIVSKSRTCSHF